MNEDNVVLITIEHVTPKTNPTVPFKRRSKNNSKMEFHDLTGNKTKTVYIVTSKT
jgi:hypothetical protein